MMDFSIVQLHERNRFDLGNRTKPVSLQTLHCGLVDDNVGAFGVAFWVLVSVVDSSC